MCIRDRVCRAGNLLETATAKGFTSLVSAIETAGLQDTFTGSESYTLFAPTNEAFAAVDTASMDKDEVRLLPMQPLK